MSTQGFLNIALFAIFWKEVKTCKLKKKVNILRIWQQYKCVKCFT